MYLLNSIIILIFGIVILYFFQTSMKKYENTKNKYLDIFNKVKIPLLFLGLFLLLIGMMNNTKIDDSVNNQFIYTTLPKF
jgi:uncharacterized alpha/beta hydrolase family protein